MQLIILSLHVLAAIALVALILIQQGKGAEAGAAFGGGASQTVFGSRGSSSFLAKMTGVLAAVFFITALGLGWLTNHMSSQSQSGLPSASMIQQQHQSAPASTAQQASQGDAQQSSSQAQQSSTQTQQSSSSAAGNAQSSASTQSTPSLDDSHSNVDNAAQSSQGNTTH